MPLPSEIDSGDGRKFQLQEVDPAGMLDLLEAAGTAANSSAWLRYALMICSVISIDGKPVIMPITKDEVKNLARRVGNTGVEAIAAVTYPLEATAAKPAPDEEAQVAKN